jgi:putative cell wall-binding protein
VDRGQVLGYLGDSGNAEHTDPHLHFEMRDADGVLVNPMASLDAAQHLDAPPETTSAASDSPIPRLAGEDRVATAIEVAAHGWPTGSSTVVLASGERYAEALPAAVLAARLDAPLLLVTDAGVSDALASALDRLEAMQVVVTGSVPDDVDGDLVASGRGVRRVGAAGDPVANAAALAREIGGESGVAVLVNGDSFADGVSAAGVAAANRWPILLTTTSVVPQASVDAWRALGVDRVALLGGTGVIAPNVEDFVSTRGGCATGQPGSPCETERLAGADRYGTSVAAATRAIDRGASVGKLLLGTGANYPDSLASGPLAARLGGLALLIDGTGRGADDESRAFLAEHASSVTEVDILGGLSAVCAAADRAVQAALGLG